MGKKAKARKVAIQRRAKVQTPLEPQEPDDLRSAFLWLLPALVLGFLVYVNTLGGEFVYDDQLQISRNSLIQDRSQFWHALTSDVWKFKGGDQTHSNYWRPSFVLWLIFNFRCFGFELFGWHLASVLLHLGVVTLAFVVVRRFAISTPVAAAIALIFAVHPVHCESVAWLSGAPDLILGAALLGSLCFVELLSKRQTLLRWVMALGLYLIALGAKEMALLFPLLIVGLLYRTEREPREGKNSWSRIVALTWPFAALAIAYFLVRRSILGITQLRPEGGASLSEAILTAPSVFAFYLRQMIVPFWIGPSYPLRVVTPANLGMGNFVIPLILTILAAWWMIRTAMVSRIARVGLALFLVPLAPVMNIVVFGSEQLVHDRYLYLPLLGFLILLVPVWTSLLQWIGSERMLRPSLLIFILAVLVSVPLGAQTVRYNHAWTSNLALWEWGVRTDPGSAYVYQQYGVHLHEAKRVDEAVAAFNRSIEITPIASTYVVRANALMDQKRFAEAEADLRAIIAKKVDAYTLYRAYRDLAVCLSSEGKADDAVNAIRQGRQRLPQYTAALTGKMASVLWHASRQSEALSEFNSARSQARTESLPESRLLLYGLGMLNVELGNRDDARAALVEFLSVTQDMLTPGVKQARSEAEAALRNLGP